MNATIDSDRDDIFIDTSHEAQVSRAVATIAHSVNCKLRYYGADLHEPGDPLPAPEAIEAEVRNGIGSLAVSVAAELLWPERYADCNQGSIPDLGRLVIAECNRQCGR